VLYQEFLRLKARLEAEGLFDVARKRPIPRLPRRIGIVTSPTGAALRDILNTLRRRYTMAEVILSPTAVQGDGAPEEIVRAIEQLNQKAVPDVILLARGGGSLEDLWAFNDERVARAISSSTAPVITGIGHETDFTIADFVSDLRAPTPTAAAELATPNRADLSDSQAETWKRLDRSYQSRLSSMRWGLERTGHKLVMCSPTNRLRSNQQRLDELEHRMVKALRHECELRRSHLKGISQQLDNLNHLSVLMRGYSVIHLQDGSLVRRVSQVRPGDKLDIQVSDGTFKAITENE
jgi:exodeoxyribonuclease VII large subunit